MFNLVESMLEKNYMKKFMFLTMLLGLMIVATNNVSAQNCVPKAGEVAVFEHVFSQSGGGKCKILTVGDYSNPTKMGLANDTMSSIKIGQGVTATVCRDFDFKGPCEVFESDDADLTKNPVIKNDMASSIKVKSDRACSPASNQKVALNWVNKTGKPIRVNWIGFDCKEQNYRVIQPDAVFVENSYVGHIFRVRDDSNTNLGLMVAKPDNVNFNIQ